MFETRRPVKVPELLLTSAYFLSTLTLLYLTRAVSII
jgi:cobalt/nickel transport system permease protein